MTVHAGARASLLHEFTSEVSRAPDARAAARAVVRLGRGLLDSSSSVLWLVDGMGALDLVASDGVPDSFLAQWQRVLPQDDVPAMHAVHLGQPLWVSSHEQYRAAAATIADSAQKANRPLAFAALPLQLEGRSLGVIVFGFAAPHPFSDDEQALALAIVDHAAQALERTRLQAAQARAISGLRAIAKVGEMVTASLDVDATLTALARAVVPDVADWCAVDLFADGNVRLLTIHHTDPAKVALARHYVRRYPSRIDEPKGSLAHIFATGESIWVRRITPDVLEGSIDDPEQLAMVRSLDPRSSVQVPFVSEGRVRGVVTFFMSESGREYDEVDRDLLMEIGRRAGHAITNASLYAREQRTRDRVTRLATVTAELARATTTADVGEAACREGAVALGASSARLHSLDGRKLRLLARFNMGESLVEQHAEIPLAIDVPLTRAAHRNEPVVLEAHDDLVREFPDFAASLPAARSEDAFMVNPLTDREGHVVGVLSFGFRSARRFTDDDRAFARTLAGHCAQAFDRARVFDMERSAADRLALLAAAGEAFAANVGYEATLQAVVRLTVPTLGDFAFFDIVEEDGQVRRTSNAHEDAEVSAILAQSRWVRSERTDVNLCALSTGQGAIHSHIDDAFLKDMATSDGHLAVLRALRLCSMITVPVVLRGEVIGALTVCHGRSGRHHSSHDLDLAGELARRGAIAVEQARLYRASTEAARRAEEANRMKDEFLAVVSHELRTPLNAILGWAHLLEGERVGDSTFVRRGVEVIRRNAHAQRELIDDILDVSRIISGKLRLQTASIDLASVVRDALEVVRPAADAKRVRLETEGIDRPVVVVGDSARLQQVVWNLLANAVKFTGADGTVRAQVLVADEQTTVRVSDSGIGIAPELLPFVFDRFRQADSSSTRAHGGLGLGLSIVRHLVELHGGTVSAASEGRGKGATFQVVLPVRGRRQTPVFAPTRSTSPVASSPHSLQGIRVLVVDDDADAREFLDIVLREAGSTHFVAGNAEAAVALFEREPIDVVISDIAMPNVDGYALLGMLQNVAQERQKPLRAIALTAYGRAEDRALATNAGFVDHLAKPVEPALLLATIGRVMGRA